MAWEEKSFGRRATDRYKTFATEFFACGVVKYASEGLSRRTVFLSTFALCGLQISCQSEFKSEVLGHWSDKGLSGNLGFKNPCWVELWPVYSPQLSQDSFFNDFAACFVLEYPFVLCLSVYKMSI